MEFGELLEILQRLGIAVGLGLIVGLQRERSGSPLGGFRTFPLATLFGCSVRSFPRFARQHIFPKRTIKIHRVVGSVELDNGAIFILRSMVALSV